jgi:hypothetical protein
MRCHNFTGFFHPEFWHFGSFISYSAQPKFYRRSLRVLAQIPKLKITRLYQSFEGRAIFRT